MLTMLLDNMFKYLIIFIIIEGLLFETFENCNDLWPIIKILPDFGTNIEQCVDQQFFMALIFSQDQKNWVEAEEYRKIRLEEVGPSIITQ